MESADFVSAVTYIVVHIESWLLQNANALCVHYRFLNQFHCRTWWILHPLVHPVIRLSEAPCSNKASCHCVWRLDDISMPLGSSGDAASPPHQEKERRTLMVSSQSHSPQPHLSPPPHTHCHCHCHTTGDFYFPVIEFLSRLFVFRWKPDEFSLLQNLVISSSCRLPSPKSCRCIYLFYTSPHLMNVYCYTSQLCPCFRL